MSHLVVDNFCPDLDKVKESAFAAGFGTWKPNKGAVGSSIYDGMGYCGDHAPMVQALMHAVGGAIVPSLMFFRITNKDTEGAYIHSDREMGSHSCIVYMTDHDEQSGTSFYRHKPTGLSAMPSFADMIADGTFEQIASDAVSRDETKWEHLDFVRGIKNRALIFHAPQFHSRVPVNGFGEDFESGRMVWVCHFYKIGPGGSLV